MEERFIPLSVPNLKGKELEYVTHAVETEWVSTAGPYVTDFEAAVAKYVGVPRAVSCQSGTAGLHVALRLCGVRAGDLVIVPTLTFIAAVNPVRYQGADPVFMDCDGSLCMDPVKLRNFCETECELRDFSSAGTGDEQKSMQGSGLFLYHKKTGRRIPALVVVHVFGNMADMIAILEIAKEYHLKVVEDATEALGTHYTSEPESPEPFRGAFAGTMGDIGVYSFNGNKIITTGGGGMIVSKDEDVLAHAKHLTTQAKSDEQNFIHDEVGYNYRLTNLQAALGLAQLEQLEDFIKVKQANYEVYREALERTPGLELLDVRSHIRSNRWFYALCVRKPYPMTGMELIDLLKSHKIQSRPIWGLIHEQLPYEGSLTSEMTEAPRYHSEVVNLPCSTSLTQEDAKYVAEVIRKGT